jgi:competence ComEA-like helix-hairpin-helix protein
MPAPAAPPPVAPPPPALPPARDRSRTAQQATGFLLGLAVALLLVRTLGLLGFGSRPTEYQPGQAVTLRIDLNRADQAELRQLPGVGEKLADHILDHRQSHGPFHRVEDLAEVPGLGPAKIEKLRPWVTVHENPGDGVVELPDVTAKKRPAAIPAPGRGKKADSLPSAIDPNRATAEELQRLPGIGPKMAQRIMEERARAPFRAVEDLRRVSGIGVKTLEKLRPHIEIGAGDAARSEPGASATGPGRTRR